MPFILLMALTGLVILYSQPLQDATTSNLRTVNAGAKWVSFDHQEQEVEKAYPKFPVTGMTMPKDRTHSTQFNLDDGSKKGLTVFVNPYSSAVLGAEGNGSGVVGLANRLHGFLNNDQIHLSLPTVSALLDDGAVMRPYVVGDLMLEIMGVWTLVLVLSGLFIWWPRRSSDKSKERAGQKIFRGRIAKSGRARWRDLHGMSGVMLFSAILVTVFSGLAWSTYWGPNFTAAANKISPNVWTDTPPSVLGTRGELDRLGNQIHWNTADIPIPASYSTGTDGASASPMSLDSVVKIGDAERMKPGYSIAFPTNTKDDAGATVYGSFTLSNSWPRKTYEARDVFLDQFSGKTLAQQSAYGYGSVSYAMDTLVSVHMGTQLGIATRIFMTLLCVLAIWSIISACVMFWKRRRPGTMGLPRRPVDVSLAKRIGLIAGVMAIAFPVWGVTAIAILTLDRFVIRRQRKLQYVFGQR